MAITGARDGPNPRPDAEPLGDRLEGLAVEPDAGAQVGFGEQQSTFISGHLRRMDSPAILPNERRRPSVGGVSARARASRARAVAAA